MVTRAGAPQRPLGLRAFDWIGRALRAAGLPLVRLDPETLLARAAQRTGLDDFGDDRFREPLRRLLASLESEAALTPFGRLVARRDLGRLLENRLRMHDTFKRHPEMGEAGIQRTLFVIGCRAPDSILHELMARTGESGAMTWEVMDPWPPPSAPAFEGDPRIHR